MPLTRDFRETVYEAAQRDPAFRRGLLTRGFAMAHSADAEDRTVGLSHLRDYINATIGFQDLAKALDKKPRSLMRMLDDKSDPCLSTFGPLVDYLFTPEGIRIHDVVRSSGPPEAKRERGCSSRATIRGWSTSSIRAGRGTDSR